MRKKKVDKIREVRIKQIIKQIEKYTDKNLRKNIHYKYSSFNDLKKIFINSYEREKNSKKKGTNDLIPLKTDINVKKKYYSQGKKLNLNSIYKSNSEKYIKFLAKKCKKKENDMLMNNIPNYRIKKQIKVKKKIKIKKIKKKIKRRKIIKIKIKKIKIKIKRKLKKKKRKKKRKKKKKNQKMKN